MRRKHRGVDGSEGSEPPSGARPAPRRVSGRGLIIGLGVVIVLLLVVPVLWNAAKSAVSRDIHVYLRGCGVEELQPGHRVVIGTVPVGEVMGIDLRDGVQMAELRLDGKYVGQVAAGSRFEVDSLNQWMPGNLGIRVYPTGQKEGVQPLENRAVIQAVPRTLPPAIPKRFYAVVAVSVVAIALLLAIAKALQRWLILLIGLAIMAAGLIYLSRMVTLPSSLPKPPQWSAAESLDTGANQCHPVGGVPDLLAAGSLDGAPWGDYCGRKGGLLP